MSDLLLEAIGAWDDLIPEMVRQFGADPMEALKEFEAKVVASSFRSRGAREAAAEAERKLIQARTDGQRRMRAASRLAMSAMDGFPEAENPSAKLDDPELMTKFARWHGVRGTMRPLIIHPLRDLSVKEFSMLMEWTEQ